MSGVFTESYTLGVLSNTSSMVAWSRGRVVAWSRGRVVAWSRGSFLSADWLNCDGNDKEWTNGSGSSAINSYGIQVAKN